MLNLCSNRCLLLSLSTVESTAESANPFNDASSTPFVFTVAVHLVEHPVDLVSPLILESSCAVFPRRVSGSGVLSICETNPSRRIVLACLRTLGSWPYPIQSKPRLSFDTRAQLCVSLSGAGIVSRVLRTGHEEQRFDRILLHQGILGRCSLLQREVARDRRSEAMGTGLEL